MFDRRFAPPPYARPNARVGQQLQSMSTAQQQSPYSPGLYSTPNSCGAVAPMNWQGNGCQGRKSVAGIDTVPAAQANAPQGSTNTLEGVSAGAAFAVSFTPFCSMCVSRIYLPADVAVQVTISGVIVAGQNFLLGGGAVPGDLFAETGSDFCCSLIEAQTCSPSNPVILTGNVKNDVPGTLTIRGTLIGSQATGC